MNMDERIARINALYHKSQNEGLTEEEKAEQAEKPEVDTEKISVPEAPGHKITVKYVEAESEMEAKAMMQKEKPKDVYYPKFDKNV